jgi:hypothetical protein
MLFGSKVKIKSFEKGFLFKDGEFQKILNRGTYYISLVTQKRKIAVISMRDPWIEHEQLDIIVASGRCKMMLSFST